jgi:hypothetical protein
MPSVPKFLTNLAGALEKDLEEVGIECEVEYESLRPTKLFRLYVISDDFEKLRYSERQSLVWRIAEDTLSPDQLRRISLILTLTGDEMAETEEMAETS